MALIQSVHLYNIILWFLQVLLPQIIIQNFYTCFCFCCSLGVFRIFVLDQNFQFLFGNGGESLSHIFKSLALLVIVMESIKSNVSVTVRTLEP